MKLYLEPIQVEPPVKEQRSSRTWVGSSPSVYATGQFGAAGLWPQHAMR